MLETTNSSLPIQSFRSVYDSTIIQFPRILDDRGNLTFVEANRHVPFDIARVYWIYDVPGGEGRGAHAHRNLHQFIVSVMGAFDVVLDDGAEKRRVHLDRAYYGLHVPPLIWANEENFSSGGICLVLASLPYDEKDYIRDYDTFLKERQK